MADGRPPSGSFARSAFRLVVSGDGSFAALVEPERVILIRLPALTIESELGVKGDAGANHVAFTGSPSRLILLSNIHTQSCLYVIDPVGPKKLGELRFATPMRIAAASGNHVLVASQTTTAVVDTSKSELVVLQLGSRGIATAGALGVDRFIVSVGGMLEERNVQTGVPARRFRFPQPVVAQHVGGDRHRIWWTSRPHPKRLEILPLTGNRQPRHIELPESAERIAADADGERLVIVGGDTGCGFVIDLDQHTSLGEVTPLAHGQLNDVAWQGGGSSLVLAPVGRPLELVPWPRSRPAVERSAPPRGVEREVATAASSSPPPPSSSPPDRSGSHSIPSDRTSLDGSGAQPAPPPEGSGAHRVPSPTNLSATRVMSIPERLALWQKRARKPLPTGPTATGWREAVAEWSRAVLAGNAGAPPVGGDDPIQVIAARLELDGELIDALCLVYGARLCGHDSIAPGDLARVVGRADEAAGGGRLAGSGALVWRRDRIRLAAVVTAACDELPLLTGTVVAGHAGAATTVGVVAPVMVGLDRISTWAASIVGALLVPNTEAEQQPHAFLLEARVRGLRPLVRWTQPDAVPRLGVVVVDDEDKLAGLEIPVVARWQEVGSS